MNYFITSTPKEINQIEKIREKLNKWAQSGNQSENNSTDFTCPSNIDDLAACDATSDPVGCYCIINESVHHLALLIGTNYCAES
jgi:hypothetical protein